MSRLRPTWGSQSGASVTVAIVGRGLLPRSQPYSGENQMKHLPTLPTTKATPRATPLTLALLGAALMASTLLAGCASTSTSVKAEASVKLPTSITIDGIALNPEGVEYNKKDHTFLLSSLNAAPVTKVNLDGTYKPFTSGEKFPMSTAGLQIDYARNRLLVAAFNGTELMDKDPKTKGTAHLRIYDLTTGVLQHDINLSSLLPDAGAYFANDIAVDQDGNAYVSDWYASAIYKVDVSGTPSVFWKNTSGVEGGPNGLDFHKDGFLLVSVIKVDKGLYTHHGLVKIPVSDASKASNVTIASKQFFGFDGMVITGSGAVVGVSNNGTAPGGNTLLKLSSSDGWATAEVVAAKAITASTTVAMTPDDRYFVINQDFSNPMAKSWTIASVGL